MKWFSAKMREKRWNGSYCGSRFIKDTCCNICYYNGSMQCAKFAPHSEIFYGLVKSRNFQNEF